MAGHVLISFSKNGMERIESAVQVCEVMLKFFTSKTKQNFFFYDYDIKRYVLNNRDTINEINLNQIIKS